MLSTIAGKRASSLAGRISIVARRSFPGVAAPHCGSSLLMDATTRHHQDEIPPRGRSSFFPHARWMSSTSGSGGGDDDDNNKDEDDAMAMLNKMMEETSSTPATPEEPATATEPDNGLEDLLSGLSSLSSFDDYDDDSVDPALSGMSLPPEVDLEAPLRRKGGRSRKEFLYRDNKASDDNDMMNDDDEEELMRLRSRKKIHKKVDDPDDMLELLELEDDIDDPYASSLDNQNTEYMATMQAEQEALQAQKLAEQRQELNYKTGRGWSDPWDLTALLASNETYDDLPDWAPEHVSRISQDRVQLLPQGIPTLAELAALPLPPPPHAHPGQGHTKAYALHRTRVQQAYVYDKVQALAAPRLPAIQAMESWQEKQDAVDELFERIEFTLQEQEVILGKHPRFGKWVEKALEKYLRSMRPQQPQKDDAKVASVEAQTTSATDEDGMTDGESIPTASTAQDEETVADTAQTDPVLDFPTKEQDLEALPLFMDCFVSEVDNEKENIPHILLPLAPLKRGANQGRMMEEWELAAHKTSKRILLRQSTRSIAQFMQTHDVARVLVTGRQGTGKTAALLSIIAAARKSGHIVLYMPHTSMLAEHGYYIEPSEHRPGMYDLPVLSEQLCAEILASHKEDLALIPVDDATIDVFFSEQDKQRLPEQDSLTVTDLLTTGAEKRSIAAMCYSAAIDILMKQDTKPLTMVIDEFNTLFGRGHYFHMDYDFDVKKSIPYNQINLFQPFFDAMGLIASEKDLLPEPVLMKRGAVIAAMSYCKPVTDDINAALVASAKELAAQPDSKMLLTEVPRFTNLEVDHIMANYESIGFGKLRLDQGVTVANPQEVAYHRILSGSVGQELMNACVV